MTIVYPLKGDPTKACVVIVKLLFRLAFRRCYDSTDAVSTFHSGNIVSRKWWLNRGKSWSWRVVWDCQASKICLTKWPEACFHGVSMQLARVTQSLWRLLLRNRRRRAIVKLVVVLRWKYILRQAMLRRAMTIRKRRPSIDLGFCCRGLGQSKIQSTRRCRKL